MDGLIYGELAERRRTDSGQREDVLTMLMAAVYEDGESMSDDELRDQLVTLFVAGYETNPIVPIVVRWLTRPQQLGPLELPADVIVAPIIWRTQRHPDLWDEPEHFDPRRFLDQTPRPHRYFPFGGGARTCLGMALAYYEMKIVLARIVSRVRYRLKPGYVARTTRRAVTFTPSNGMPVIVE